MIKAEKKGNPHPKIDISKGRIQKEIVEFSTKRLTPPLLVEKKKKKWSTRHEMNSVWYGSSDTCQTRIWAEKGPPHPKIKEKKVYLKMIIRQNPMF